VKSLSFEAYKTITMKAKLMVLCLSIIGLVRLSAQDATHYAALITKEDLKDNLSILASDAMEGRETGKRGQKMAAAFISTHYQELGLNAPVNGSHYQPVNLYKSTQGEVYIKVGENQYNNFTDVVYYGNHHTDQEVSTPVVFAGKGKIEELEQIDVNGKAAIVMLGGDENFRGPLEAVRGKGANMVFFVNPNASEFKELASQFKAYLSGGRLSLKKPETAFNNLGVFFISPAVAEKALNTSMDKLTKAVNTDAKKNALKKIKTGSLTYKVTNETITVKSENVLGYLEGSDKKDEVLIITSHYDHIGKRDGKEGDLINNGADDDGSGTVAVMQLAKVFAQAKKDGKGPRRSILFMNVTGEEEGLLGSDYYTQNPVFPLTSTVVNLNIDMIGRRDAQHATSPPYVYVIGSDKLSTELHNLNEAMNKQYTNMVLDYTYNDQNHPDRLYYRSDHWNFAKNNIPIIFYFDGIHEDYHKPTDEVSKIEFDHLAKRTQLVFYTAWEIANREQRIVPDVK
jgi:hypothetical protein